MTRCIAGVILMLPENDTIVKVSRKIVNRRIEHAAFMFFRNKWLALANPLKLSITSAVYGYYPIPLTVYQSPQQVG